MQNHYNFVQTLKAGSQYDAGTIVASWASSDVGIDLIYIPALRHQQPASNQSDCQKIDTRDRIWLMKKYIYSWHSWHSLRPWPQCHIMNQALQMYM